MKRRRSQSTQLQCKLLRDAANSLTTARFPDGPPYDPWVLAEDLGVTVYQECLRGQDGYADVRANGAVVVLDPLAPLCRKRFTLAHELGHIVLHRAWSRGVPLNLVRYRASGCPAGVTSDPIEETLCNYFAAELLMPTEVVREIMKGKRLHPDLVYRVASLFITSVQAAATRLCDVLGRRRFGISLWELEPWPMPIWWAGRKVGATRDWERVVKRAIRSSTQSHLSLELRRECVAITTCWSKGRLLLTTELASRRPDKNSEGRSSTKADSAVVGYSPQKRALQPRLPGVE